MAELEIGDERSQRLLVGSAYLQTGQRLTSASTDILQQIATTRAQNAQLRTIVGGDWNLESVKMAKVARSLGMEVVAPASPTCFGSARTASCIDYALADRALATTAKAQVDMAAPTRPHRPVSVDIPHRLEQFQSPGVAKEAEARTGRGLRAQA